MTSKTMFVSTSRRRGFFAALASGRLLGIAVLQIEMIVISLWPKFLVDRQCAVDRQYVGDPDTDEPADRRGERPCQLIHRELNKG